MSYFIGNLYFLTIVQVMFTYYIKKIPSLCLYNIQIYKNRYVFGNLNFQIQQTRAILNNIEIDEQRRGYGSYFLKKFESYVQNVHNVNNISLLAWQPYGSDNVVKFFEKHGYKEENSENNRQIYDDSIVIYDLHKMWKSV